MLFRVQFALKILHPEVIKSRGYIKKLKKIINKKDKKNNQNEQIKRNQCVRIWKYALDRMYFRTHRI